MNLGFPRETKTGERRVILDPAGAGALVRDGHRVRIEAGAGSGAGHADADYAAAGAEVVSTAAAWDAELVVKVKEIRDEDLPHVRTGQTLFGFQQLVGAPRMTRALAERGVTAIAFEMVRDPAGGFPLLAPMSVISGRLAVIVGANALLLPNGGNGTLLAAGPGLPPARVLVLGAGNAGLAASEAALACGAKVTLLTRSARSRDNARARFGVALEADLASPEAIERHAPDADLVIGAVLVPGEATPKLLPRTLVRRMKRGAVIVDICIDGGGVAETSRPTTHADPCYMEEGVVHYCVPNMPAAVAPASAAALSAAVLPFVRELARRGIAQALRADAGLRAGVLLRGGRCTHPVIAAQAGLACEPLAPGPL